MNERQDDEPRGHRALRRAALAARQRARDRAAGGRHDPADPVRDWLGERITAGSTPRRRRATPWSARRRPSTGTPSPRSSPGSPSCSSTASPGSLVLQRLGVPLTGLVAPATVAGVALGFGAQRSCRTSWPASSSSPSGSTASATSSGSRSPGIPTGVTGTVEDVTLRVTTAAHRQRRGGHHPERPDRAGHQPVPRLGPGRGRRPRARQRRRQPGQRAAAAGGDEAYADESCARCCSTRRA